MHIFHGEDDDLPLCIGKSVNLRTCARCCARPGALAISCTAGEIGALLLEARLIKEMLPLFNQKLRCSRQLCALRLTEKRPEVVYSKDFNFATESGLYGLFSSLREAQGALRSLADQHKLCYGALGLEKLKPGKACFHAMLRQCAGVCRGDETPSAHRQRFFTALEDLQIATWPYPGSIGLVERFNPIRGDLRAEPDRASTTCPHLHPHDVQIHVVRHWCYLGSVTDRMDATALDSVSAGFDAEGYKILCKPVLSGRAEIILI